MKKRFVVFVLVLLQCAAIITASAAAEGGSAAERGLKKLQTAVNWKCIVLPQTESWLDEWKTLYARMAWYAPNLFVEGAPIENSGVYMPFLCEGTEVTVVAEENDMSCILYRDADYTLCAGWIKSIRLLDEFPGTQLVVGEEREGDFTVLHEAEQRWSGCWLPGTERQYTVLDKPVSDCVGFTFDYQLIAENTSEKWRVFGPRVLLVNDGEDWIPLGRFSYPETGTVRVQVWLKEPTDIAQIATVALCNAPNLFDFRQTAFDFLLEER